MVCVVSGVLFQGWDVGTLGNTLSGCVTQYPRVGPSEAWAIHPTHLSFYCMHKWALGACRLVHKWMDEGLNPKWITNKPTDWINVGSCCCNAVLSKIGGVGFVCESCPMLGFCTKIKQTSGFSQIVVVYSVFVGFVTQLSSPSNVCVERGHTCVYTKLTFCLHHARLAHLYCLHCTLVW